MHPLQPIGNKAYGQEWESKNKYNYSLEMTSGKNAGQNETNQEEIEN